MSELLDYLVQNVPDFRRARLPALYSDFASQRALNPDGFAANLAAWKRGLSSAALAGRAPSRSAQRNHFTLELSETLLHALQSNQYGQPLSLPTVLADSVANGEMIPTNTFLKSKESIYYRSWGSYAWNLLGWGLRQAGLTGAPGSDGKIPRGSFTVIANLETGAKIFGEKTRNRTSRFERTFSKAHFRRTFEDTLLDGRILSDNDFEVLVKFLSRDKKILVTDESTIKIRASEEDEGAKITQEDTAIASLKELIEDLTKQTEVLSTKVDELNNSAKEAVGRKNRVQALAALKSKKQTETTLSQRYATLNQLEEVASRIEQASDNVQLVKVMQSSTVALKSLNAQVGGAVKVDEVLDALRDQMGEVDEVGNIIAEAGPMAAVDEEEVDEELEAMLAEERRKEEEIERARREAQQEKEAEETRRRLAELDKLGPVANEGREAEAQLQEENARAEAQRAATPATATAGALEKMSIEEEPARVAAE